MRHFQVLDSFLRLAVFSSFPIPGLRRDRCGPAEARDSDQKQNKDVQIRIFDSCQRCGRLRCNSSIIARTGQNSQCDCDLCILQCPRTQSVRSALTDPAQKLSPFYRAQPQRAVEVSFSYREEHFQSFLYRTSYWLLNPCRTEKMQQRSTLFFRNLFSCFPANQKLYCAGVTRNRTGKAILGQDSCAVWHLLLFVQIANDSCVHINGN
jgi:hypothetical protein